MSWIKKYNNQIIGLFIIILSIWIIFYFIPELIILLFQTFLGNFLLLLSCILLFSVNKMYGIIFSLFVLILYCLSILSKTEHFTDKSQQDFIKLQHTIHPNSIFDMQVLNKQVTQEELDYYNQNGIWYWSPEVKQLYKNAVLKNPYIRTFSGDSLMNAQKIYNQNAILQILGQQTKEGQFLLTGIQIPKPIPDGYGEFAYSSGLKPRDMDIIKCNMKTDLAYPEKTHFLGKRGIFGEQLTTTEAISNEDLPKVIPGFSFLNGSCNPCNAINSVPKYDCPFLIKTSSTDNSISPLWKYQWFR